VIPIAELTKSIGPADVKIKSLHKAALAELQALLAAAGYEVGKADGIFGPKTAKAFAGFKSNSWLTNHEDISARSLERLAKEAEERASGKAPTESSASAIIAIPKASGKTSKMLPSGSAVYVESPIITGGHFSWSELTKGGTRWPRSLHVEDRIVAIATQLEKVRSCLGDRQITITSGYRPNNDPLLGDVNKSVGGVRSSRHIMGDAVDIAVDEMSVGEVFNALATWWVGGIAPDYKKGFVHIDLGYPRTWLYS
jgi:Peptidase M15